MASTEKAEEEGSGSTPPSGPPIPSPTVTPERQVTLVSVLEISTQLADLSVWRKATLTFSGSDRGSLLRSPVAFVIASGLAMPQGIKTLSVGLSRVYRGMKHKWCVNLPVPPSEGSEAGGCYS